MTNLCKTTPRIWVCVATYRRPQLLAELLASLRNAKGSETLGLVVIDNDPDGTARRVIDASEMPVLYAVESRPGIAAARTASLALVPDSAAAVIFVDDDERVTEEWVEQLVGYWERSGADVVTGPAIPELPTGAPEWIRRGKFLELPRQASGPHPYLPATNNTLVSMDFLRRTGILEFDEEFSMTGGSDSEFFLRVKRAGGSVHWCDEAVVTEVVPPARLTARWIWKRGVRSGNVIARLQLRERSRVYVLMGAFARLVYGLGKVAQSLVIGKGLQYSDAIYVMRFFGFLGALRGRLVIEYARKQESQERTPSGSAAT